MSVAVSKLGCTELIFVQLGAKVNGAYYRDELLAKHMLPAIRQIAGDHFIFQHRARRIVLATSSTFSVAQRRSSSPQTCGRQTAQVCPVDYKIWGVMQERLYVGDPISGRSEATSDCRVVRSAAEYRRRRCRSVARTSALLRGNERPSLGYAPVDIAMQGGRGTRGPNVLL